jgi:hypothetical protein
MGRKPIGAQPMTPAERQQRRRAKVHQERQKLREAEERRLTRNADRREWRDDREGRRLMLEHAKIEAGGEFINFRDDTVQQIARVIMQNIRGRARKLLEVLDREVCDWEDATRLSQEWAARKATLDSEQHRQERAGQAALREMLDKA